ncbi:hypothetical protein M5E86_10790 [Blautia wexlerae]|nr:hypothetical protein M5E86_10790 [Blautia wexlerae]
MCEIFDLNPYKLQADGAVLIGIRGGEALVQRLRNEGFMAEVIGQTSSGNDRLLYSGGSARYLERPAEDELRATSQRVTAGNLRDNFLRKDRRLITRGIKTKWQN